MESIYQSEETRRALEFAAKAHEGQVRKYTGEPYITHPMAVAEMLLEHGIEFGAMHIAALLHDTVEDTDVTHEDILRELVSMFTNLLSDSPSWIFRVSVVQSVRRLKHFDWEVLRLLITTGFTSRILIRSRRSSVLIFYIT